MTILTTDLDNTLIYSYKHDIGRYKRCVEVYQGREVSFITTDTYRLLQQVQKRMMIVPVTTRTIEQYERIDFGIVKKPYALVCNGGILLKDGKEDDAWYQESLSMISESSREIQKAVQLLREDQNICFEIRYIRELFVFTKSNEPEVTAAHLRECLDSSKAEVFTNGIKVYAVPKGLDKGTAVRRFKKYIGADTIIAAGDSTFDIPMLETADYAVCPAELTVSRKNQTVFCQQLLSECMLQTALEIDDGRAENAIS